MRVLGYRPAAAEGTRPAVLHLHGGGYVLGGPEMADDANRRLASSLGCAVFSVAYRLAPETPFPGALEDCYAALLWLHARAGALRIDAGRIGVKGESAGGGLAAGLALLARDRSGPPLAFQHLIYPMLDDRTGAKPEPGAATGRFVWTRENNRFGWSAYLGRAPGLLGPPAYAAPARAQDLSGLPPAFVSVGALDLFLDEDIDYARRLAHAGVPTELHVYPGAVHRFQEADAGVAQAARRDSRDALRRALCLDR